MTTYTTSAGRQVDPEEELAELKTASQQPIHNPTAFASAILLKRALERAIILVEHWQSTGPAWDPSTETMPHTLYRIAHRFDEFLIGEVGEANFSLSTSSMGNDYGVSWPHEPPPGFVYLTDAELAVVAQVPKGGAERWMRLLNWDLRGALQAFAQAHLRPAGGGQ